MARKKPKTTKASKSRKPAVQKKTKKSVSSIKKKSKISVKSSENVIVSQEPKETPNKVESVCERITESKNIPDTKSDVNDKAKSSKSQNKKSSKIPIKNNESLVVSQNANKDENTKSKCEKFSEAEKNLDKTNENLFVSQGANNTFDEITKSVCESFTESENIPVKSKESLVVSLSPNNALDEITKSLCESFTEPAIDTDSFLIDHKNTTESPTKKNSELNEESDNISVVSQNIDETLGEISSLCETLIDTENVSVKSNESKAVLQDPNDSLDVITTLCGSLLDSENIPDSSSDVIKKTKKLESSFEKRFELTAENNEVANVSQDNDETLDDLSLLCETFTDSISDNSSDVDKTAKKPSSSTEKKTKLSLKRKIESDGVSQGTKKTLDEINALCEGLAETPSVPDIAEGSNNSDDESIDYKEFMSNFEKAYNQMTETFESDTSDFTNTFDSAFKEQMRYLQDQQQLGRISSKQTASMFASAMKFMNVYHDEMGKAILQAKQSYNKFHKKEEEFLEKSAGVLKEIEELESELNVSE